MTTSQQPSQLGQELNNCLTAIGLELNLEHDSANWSLSDWLTWLNDNSYDIKTLEQEIHSLFSETSEEELYSDIHSSLLAPSINTKATLNDLSALTAATNSEALQRIENVLKQQIEAQQELTSTAGGMSTQHKWEIGGGSAAVVTGLGVLAYKNRDRIKRLFNDMFRDGPGAQPEGPATEYGPRGGMRSDNGNVEPSDDNNDSHPTAHDDLLGDEDYFLNLNQDLLKNKELTPEQEEERLHRISERHSSELIEDLENQKGTNAPEADPHANDNPRGTISDNGREMIAGEESELISNSTETIKTSIISQSSGEISAMEDSASEAIEGGVQEATAQIETGEADAVDALADAEMG